MAESNCPTCGHIVALSADECKNCGHRDFSYRAYFGINVETCKACDGKGWQRKWKSQPHRLCHVCDGYGQVVSERSEFVDVRSQTKSGSRFSQLGTSSDPRKVHKKEWDAHKERAKREIVEATEFSKKFDREWKQNEFIGNIFWAGFLLSFPIGILSLACGGLGGSSTAMITGIIVLIIASLCFFGMRKFSP
jgi:hypothetical protein